MPGFLRRAIAPHVHFVHPSLQSPSPLTHLEITRDGRVVLEMLYVASHAMSELDERYILVSREENEDGESSEKVT